MNRYNKVLQNEINSYEDTIDDLKSVLGILENASDEKETTLYVDEKVAVIFPVGISALKSAINGKIIALQSAIRNVRKRMI